jgi:hypothetical protein
MNQPKPAIDQFRERAFRILNEYFTPHKYSNFANANLLAGLFPLDSFMPSDGMFTAEAKIQIAKGAIRETANWTEAFAGFHQATGDVYRLDCNLPILEKALQGRKPTPELLVQIASENAAQLVMTASASAQAARDQKHEALFHELAPRLITDIPAGSNRYAVALDNKRIEAERQRIWDLSLEELEALKTKKNLRSMSKEELKAIVNSAEPARREQYIFGNRHADALPEQILTLRERGAAEVKAGIFRQIPDEWKIPGKDLTVPFSHNLIAQLPKEIVARLLQMYGNNQLTYMCELTKFKQRQKAAATK